jgi:hypothetical protein
MKLDPRYANDFLGYDTGPGGLPLQGPAVRSGLPYGPGMDMGGPTH